MKKFSIFFLMPMLVLALFGACTGDDGEDGLDGADGTNGTNGTNGETGTANVIYSDWSGLAGTWRDSTNYGTVKVNHLIAPDITQDILNEGVVLCYFKSMPLLSPIGYVPAVHPLPFTGYSDGQAFTLDFALTTRKIIFRAFTDDNSGTWSPLLYNFATYYYRYIVIPGGVAATKSTNDLSKLSYEQICTLFNISE